MFGRRFESAHLHMEAQMKWYAIRVTYSRELKFQTQLREAGFETFVPMCRKKVERNGKTQVVIVPAVSNLCFVKTTREQLRDYMYSLGEACPAHFIWNKATRNPIVVPDKAMEDFMTISLLMSDETLYLNEISPKLRAGQKVRVKEGPFQGVEGIVVRIKNSRRVMVELPGLFAVATNYIPVDNLELI